MFDGITMDSFEAFIHAQVWHLIPLVLHPSTAPECCTLVLHPGAAPQSYTLVLHCSMLASFEAFIHARVWHWYFCGSTAAPWPGFPAGSTQPASSPALQHPSTAAAPQTEPRHPAALLSALGRVSDRYMYAEAGRRRRICLV